MTHVTHPGLMTHLTHDPMTRLIDLMCYDLLRANKKPLTYLLGYLLTDL